MTLFAEAGPFQLGPEQAPRVLLFHGLTGSPVELWPLGRALAAIGYRVEAPLWRGHGTIPEDLLRVTAHDLVEQALSAVCEGSPVAIVGLSMGSLLATIAASHCPSLSALVLLAPPLKLQGPNALFDQLGRFPALRTVPAMMRKRPPTQMDPCDELPPFGSEWLQQAAEAARDALCEFAPAARYARLPLRWSVELQALRDEARRRAPGLRAPVLVLHGRQDRTAHPASALLSCRWFNGDCRVRFFERSPHVLTIGPERAVVAAEVASFIREHAPSIDPAQTA